MRVKRLKDLRPGDILDNGVMCIGIVPLPGMYNPVRVIWLLPVSGIIKENLYAYGTDKCSS